MSIAGTGNSGSDVASLREKLAAVGQEQVLRFHDALPPESQRRLASQLGQQDLGLLKALADEYVVRKPVVALPTDIKPVTPYPRRPAPGQESLYADALARGFELLKAGKVAAFLVAGGQGTRLGYDGPKGEYPVTPIKGKPLFQVFAEQLHNHSRTYGKVIPWYVMTSEVNDAPTRAFFKKNLFFGYSEADVFFFQQGMMPAFGTDGKLLLGEKDSLALSPDGHGGSLRALDRSGALADMKRRGVEHLSYFQVDNPLVHTIDPLFLGLHDLTGSEMSSKTVPKANALEKVGNFCVGDGKTQVIEYSDLPEALAKQTNPDGGLAFNAGSIAIHALRVSFIERLNAGGRLELPWHRADKKVPYVDEAGTLVKPDKVNAVKLEQFVFDAIPLAANPLVFTTSRAEEFSPVKNAQGDDSPATCKRDQVRRNAEWLELAGVDVPRANSEPAATIEISPLYAANAEQLKQRKPTVTVKPGVDCYIE
jgi:UDP-N-acetylglucosamine/UDP-N-acetylgalactosamine diphosphorylase